MLIAPGDAHAHIIKCVLMHRHLLDVRWLVLSVVVESTIEVHLLMEISHSRPEPFPQNEVVGV